MASSPDTGQARAPWAGGNRVPLWAAGPLLTVASGLVWWGWRTYDLQAGLERMTQGGQGWPPPRRAGVDPLVPWLPAVLPWAGVGAVAALVPMVALGVRYPQSQPVWWLRAQWRRLTRYQPKWRKVMRLTGLSAKQDGRVLAPRIVKVRSTAFVDQVLVRMVHGDTHDSFTKLDRAVALAHSFDAMRVVVQYEWREPKARGRSRDGKGGRIWLEFLRRNRLTAVIPAPPIPRAGDIDLKRVPIGILEDGRPATIPLLGGHSLWAGMIGAGKSAGAWCAIRGVAPLIRDGTVQLWGADGKNGAELGIGKALFHHLVDNDPDKLEAMLAKLVAEKDRRGVILDGGLRKIEPSPSMPLIVVWLDEYAGTVAMLQDRQQAGRIMRFIGVLASQGRAMGIHLMACAQEPLAEVVKPRGYFSHRLAFRFMEDRYGDLVLGAGARARGARCDEIPQDQPGIFYMQVENEISPRRGRCAWVTDDDIRLMAAEYAPGGRDHMVTTGVSVGAPAPVAELQPAATKPQADRKASVVAPAPKPRRVRTDGKHLPMTDEQDVLVKDMLGRWKAQAGVKVRYVVVTIPTTPKSKNSSDMRGMAGVIPKHEVEKKRLQDLLEVALIQRGLEDALPLRKDGRMVAVVTYRFARLVVPGDGRRAQEAPNYNVCEEALGDALYRSREGRPDGWWIRHDSDDEWTVLSAEVLRVKGPAMTTVRLWWREPTDA